MDRRRFISAGVAISGMGVLTGVRAQGYPDKTIRVVVPFPAASSTDIVARVGLQRLGERKGWSVIVDNKAGAGGNIGSKIVASAPADGYTLLMATAANAVGASYYSSLDYEFMRDFTPVALLATSTMVIMAGKHQPYQDIRGLVAYAKANPGKLNFGSGGNGTINHLAGELFNQAAGTKINHVPYKSGSQAVTDLIGGQIELVFDGITASLANIRAGKLKPLAVTSATRVKLLPEVPTVAESGFPGFEAGGFYGLNAPAGTPKEIVEKLNREIVTVLRLPDVRDKLEANGAIASDLSPEQYAAFLRKEVDKWAVAVKKSGLRANA